MSKKKLTKKSRCNDVEVWTEEQYEEYLKGLYRMDFIAGFTDNDVSYGAFIDENDKDNQQISRNISSDANDDLPF